MRHIEFYALGIGVGVIFDHLLFGFDTRLCIAIFILGLVFCVTLQELRERDLTKR